MTSFNNWLPLKQPLGELNIFWLSASVGLIFILLVSRYNARSEERAVGYEVDIPKPCLPGWHEDQSSGMKDALEIRDKASKTLIPCYCPANGNFLGHVAADSPSDIDSAISKAALAQRNWAKTTFGQRRRVLRTLLTYTLDHQELIAKAACLDSGKTKIDAFLGEILITAEKLKWTILHGEKALRPERRPTNFLMAYKINEVRWEPLGVVAACVSWNYPFHNVIGPIISAIFAGNGIVVKGSEATAWSTRFFVEIARSALRACKHSPDLIQGIVCWPEVAPHLTSHPRISHLTFIGSRRVGLQVAAAAAKNLTPVCMELGGKDAAIILDDVRDLEQVSSILMRGVFQSAGQNCIGIERIIACQGVYDRLVDILEGRIKSLRMGSALDAEEEGEEVDVGAMISNNNFDRLEALVGAAVKEGARCLVGGQRMQHPKHSRGHYFSPTLLVDVTADMQIARDETFAPICLLMKATDVEAAIDMANSTEYGLGASVFGRDARNLERVVAGVDAGMVSVNDFGVYYAVQLPFGGVKGSGYGRFAGEEGLRGLCNTKAVCRDRWPQLVRTTIPKVMDYPIRNAARAWRMCVGIVELAYAEGLRKRLVGLRKVIRNG